MVVFIGPPGAGKSLQASLLEERGAAHWISVGKLFRENLTGEELKKLDEGVIMPDATTIALIKEKLSTIHDSELVILDGFPRRETQTEWLISDDSPRKLDGVILLTLDPKHIMDRLLKRGRADDKEEVIKDRIKLFNDDIGPIIDDFKNFGVKVREIDSNGPIEEVYEKIHTALRELGVERLS